jgi:hypothetical protein
MRRKQMSSIITIVTEYYLNADSVVDLSPKSWDDVDEWYIKWDILNVKFKGEDDWHIYTLESNIEDGIDWSRPNWAEIRDKDETTIDTKENF